MTTYLLEHPATLLPNRSPHLRDVMDLDMRRIGKLLTGWRPVYADDFQIIAHWSQIGAWFDATRPKRVALDLETDAAWNVDMIGMAVSEQDARLLLLPDPEGLVALWDAIAKHGCEVIVHYGEGIEVEWLFKQHGERLPFLVHDLHKLFHAWDPEYASAGRDKDDRKEGGGSGALAFIQSLYTWRPYHKHLLKLAKNAVDKAHYCMLDCVVTWEAFHRVEEVCRGEQPAAYAAYTRDAVPLLPIMVRSKLEGWNLDREKFTRRRGELQQTARAQADGLLAVYGDGIRPKGKHAKTAISTAGLKAVLKARGVKLPVEKRADGRTSETLNREARQKLIGRHPELADLDAYWATQDLLSDCYKKIAGRDGRVHASWSGYLSSWRWRCTKPNIAQWPEHEREVYCADEGNILVQFDTSAGEYRWFAGESGDPALLLGFRAYDSSGDPRLHPHVRNTAVLFNVDPSVAATWKSSSVVLEKAKYTFSKNYIYRLMYSYDGGIDELRATAAKAGLRFSRRDIKEFDKVWFKTYPVAAAYRERAASQALRTRYVSCREWGYGRRLHGQDDSKLKNVALNHVEQAGIAGLINRTIREVEVQFNVVPRANMHDGIIYEIPVVNVDSFIQFVKGHMEAPIASLRGLKIPVDVKIGDHWGRGLHDYTGGLSVDLSA